jgi:hypothetical protein
MPRLLREASLAFTGAGGQSRVSYDHYDEEPALPVDPKDEAYTEACEEIDRFESANQTRC